MGTKLAPSYANLFMSRFAGQHVYTNPSHPILRKRFTDDIFLLWPHRITAIQQLSDHLNAVYPIIKFTCEISHQIPFSYLMMDVKQGKMYPLIHTCIWTIIQNIHPVWRNPYFIHHFSDWRKSILNHYIFWKHKYICMSTHMCLFYQLGKNIGKSSKHSFYFLKPVIPRGNTLIMFITTYNRANPNSKDIISKTLAKPVMA